MYESLIEHINYRFLCMQSQSRFVLLESKLLEGTFCIYALSLNVHRQPALNFTAYTEKKRKLSRNTVSAFTPAVAFNEATTS